MMIPKMTPKMTPKMAQLVSPVRLIKSWPEFSIFLAFLIVINSEKGRLEEKQTKGGGRLLIQGGDYTYVYIYIYIHILITYIYI